jgi:hypothetical protein
MAVSPADWNDTMIVEFSPRSYCGFPHRVLQGAIEPVIRQRAKVM